MGKRRVRVRLSLGKEPRKNVIIPGGPAVCDLPHRIAGMTPAAPLDYCTMASQCLPSVMRPALRLGTCGTRLIRSFGRCWRIGIASLGLDGPRMRRCISPLITLL